MGGVIPEYDGSSQFIDEAVYSAAVSCALGRGGRPASARMRLDLLMTMALGFGYQPSGRVHFGDGMLALWLPWGFIEIRPDASIEPRTALLFDAEGKEIMRIGFAV